MITIDVRGLEEVNRQLQRMSREMPRSVARALNDTGFKVMAAERAEINAKFDRPKAWIAKNVRVFKATPDQLSATVGATDWHERAGMQPKGTAWDRILSPHVYGGSRLHKASEQRLQLAGLLPRGWFTVPGQAAKLDRYGNISGGEIVAILSWVGAMGQYAGDNTNKRDRLTKRKNKAERRGEAYFVARVGNPQRIHPGIYKRLRSRQIKPVLMFVSNVDYQQRLDWFGVGNRVVAEEFPRAFAAALDDLAQ